MTIYYVNSAASGANNGTSKTDAWNSLASAVGVAAGDEVWVSHTHSEANGAFNFSNGTLANPVRILSVNFDTDVLTPGAAWSSSTSSAAFWGFIITYGLSVSVTTTGTITLGTSGNRQVWMSPTFSVASAGLSTGANANIDLFQPTLGVGPDESGVYRPSSRARLRIFGGTYTLREAGQTSAFNCNFGRSILEVSDMEFVNSCTNILTAMTTEGHATFRRCKMPTFTNYMAAGTVNAGATALFESCSGGTITVPPVGLTKFIGGFGEVSATLSRYRSGGADDGLQANPYAWELTTNANAQEIFNPLESPPIARWIEPDASISGATAKGIFTSTRCQPLATPAALTTDASSTWNGTGVGTKQKIDHVLSNGQTLTVYVASSTTLYNDEFWIEVSEPDQVGGPVIVRCFLAKPSTTVYVDPVVAIDGDTTGKSWYAEGSQFFDFTESGGGGGGNTYSRGRLVNAGA